MNCRQDLAEFIGIILGDGSLTRFQCVIYLHSQLEQQYVEYVTDLISRLFERRPKIYYSRRYRVIRISINSVNLVKYLVSQGLSMGNKVRQQVGVPDWIWADDEYRKACIRGLIDTDGSFIWHHYQVRGKDYCYPKLSFTNHSEPLLDFVFEGLQSLGYHPKRSCKYQIWLHRVNEVYRYLEEIGVGNHKLRVKEIRRVARVV